MSSNPIKQNVGKRVVDLMQAEGIDTVFSVPSPGLMQIQHEAVERGVRVVSPRHEQAGGFMADAYARMTGKPGLVMAGEGPGTANLVPAAICASKENIPVVFLASQRGRRFDAAVRRSKFQYTPQPRFFEPAVKYTGIVEFPEQIDEVMQEAFRQAMTGRSGPVYVELPDEHQFSELEFEPAPPPGQYRMTRQQADPDGIERAAGLLRAAECPVIVAGTGVHTARGHDELLALVETLQCPVIATWGGRGVLPEDHPQLLIYATEPANAAIAKADVILAVGTSLGENMHYGRVRHFAPDDEHRQWILIERDPSAIGVNRRIDVPLIGNLKDVMPQLRSALAPATVFRSPELLKSWRETLATSRQQVIQSAPETVPVHPGRLMVEIDRVLPRDTVVVRDGGSTALFDLAYRIQLSNDYVWTSKFGHLGTGLPYAIGAQLAVRDANRRVCLITGDSAFMFHISELETAVRHNLPVVTVVNYDGAWGMEVPSFDETFGKRIEVEHGPVRLDKVAQGFGAHGEYCETTAQIGPAIERAFAANKPAVVQVVTDGEVNGNQAPNWEEFESWYGADGAYTLAKTDQGP